MKADSHIKPVMNFASLDAKGLVAKYIMSANENSDSESSMGKFSAQGYHYEPEYSMHLYKLDQHLLEHLYMCINMICCL